MSLETALNRSRYSHLVMVQAVTLRHWRRSGLARYQAYADKLQQILEDLEPHCNFSGWRMW